MLDRVVATLACPKPAATPLLVDRIRAFFGVEPHLGEISIKAAGLGTDVVIPKDEEGFASVVHRATVV